MSAVFIRSWGGRREKASLSSPGLGRLSSEIRRLKRRKGLHCRSWLKRRQPDFECQNEIGGWPVLGQQRVRAYRLPVIQSKDKSGPDRSQLRASFPADQALTTR